MAKQVQFRRGTTAQHSIFTGALAELTIDTDKKVAVIHDGVTVGGFPLVRTDGVVATSTTANALNTANVYTGVSFNSITGLSSTTPIVAGTAAIGTGTTVARADHVHPVQTSVSGNAGTATKLATARTINGVSFDGSENIIVEDSTKLPLSGGAITGPITGLRGNYIALSTNNIDLSLGDVFSKSISSATTFTLSNIPTSGQTFGFFLEITNNNGSVVWWSGINWDSKTTPTLTAVGSDIFSFYTYDGGVTWKGAVHSRNVG